MRAAAGHQRVGSDDLFKIGELIEGGYFVWESIDVAKDAVQLALQIICVTVRLRISVGFLLFQDIAKSMHQRLQFFQHADESG